MFTSMRGKPGCGGGMSSRSFSASAMLCRQRLVGAQMPEYAMKDVLDVVDALLQVGRRQLLEGDDVLVESGEDGPLGTGAAFETVVQVLLDAAILHEH